jgi:hypothetical protein
MSRRAVRSDSAAKRRGPQFRRAGVVLVVLACAGIAVSAVVAGRVDWSTNTAMLDAALVKAEPTRVADIEASDGLSARGVFAQVTSTGHFCLSDAPLGAPEMGGGGCNSVDDPLGGRPISVSLAYDGGPAITDVKDARLIGLASAGTSRVRVEMTDHTSRAIKLKKITVASRDLLVFGYRFKKSDLKKGIGPFAVVSYDTDGTELGRQATGIGG